MRLFEIVAKSWIVQGGLRPLTFYEMSTYLPFNTDPGSGARLLAGPNAGYIVLRSEGANSYCYSDSDCGDQVRPTLSKIAGPTMTLDCSHDLCLPFKWLVFERSRCEMDGVESPSLDFLWEVQNVETEGDAGIDPPVPGVMVAEDAGNGPRGGERIYMPEVVTNSGTVESVGEGDSSKMVVPMPFGVLACPCRQAFCSVYEFELHMDRAHADVDLRYRCDICTKTCLRAHGAKIHRAKCRGQKTRTRTDLPWGCNVCAMAFQTKSGLSQHKRHRHPAIRNLERKADCKSVVEGEVTELTVKPTKLWSLDEVERLRELEVKHQGKRSINLLIAAELVGKSNKQVSEKRRALFGSRAKSVVKKSVSFPQRGRLRNA